MIYVVSRYGYFIIDFDFVALFFWWYHELVYNCLGMLLASHVSFSNYFILYIQLHNFPLGFGGKIKISLLYIVMIDFWVMCLTTAAFWIVSIE